MSDFSPTPATFDQEDTRPLSTSVDSGLTVDPDFSGLVISPISGETDFLAELAAEQFRFPSSEMLGAAAALWPIARDTPVGQGWHGLPGRGVATKTGLAIAGQAENWINREGPRARVEIAPGLVRIARRDESRAERSRDLAAERDLAARTHELEQLARPMVFADLQPLSRGTRAVIDSWSADSRARMIAAICELDLSGIVGGENLPCMVTLTLPGDWLAVTPDAATAAKKFHNFNRAWRDKWGSALVCIWKREFQRRGAPHWHIWTVPPVPMHRMSEFKSWLSETWTRVLFGRTVVTHPDCSCSEACRSLRAGTGVDFAEGLRARDPKRLAIYFLKESLGGEGKSYQNGSPVEWAGQSVGRFWGYRGIEKAVVALPVDAGVDVQVLRCLRRWQRAQGVTREVTVQRLDTRSGTVRTRKVRRPARTIGSAGWVAVNSGADLAAQLGRYATMVSAALWRERELFAVDPELDTQETVSWPLWAAHGPLRDGGGFPVPAAL